MVSDLIECRAFRLLSESNKDSGFPERVVTANSMQQGSGFRVQGSGFRVQGSGFRVQGSGFRVQGSGMNLIPKLPACQLPDVNFLDLEH
jgi:hypothetical protein